MSEQEQDQRWTKHFSEVLNRPDPVNSPDILTAPDDLDIMSTDAPTWEEPTEPQDRMHCRWSYLRWPAAISGNGGALF